MKISFSPPFVNQEIIDEVLDALNSGWITTGPKTKQFERDIAAYCGAPKVLCLNSATAGMELMLRWYGVKEGDEVIVPAYTYAATANVVVHCGATPVMVDVKDDFLIDVEKVRQAITSRTKVIIPVDIFGYPCDFDELKALVESPEIRSLFQPANERQEKLGRIMIMDDAAHSIGAEYKGKKVGTQADAVIFSFHAVKNITTSEGGAICINLNPAFDPEEVYRELNIKSLHGQTKDAMSKTQTGAWRYDIIEAGYKFNMPDVLAAIGLATLRIYERDIIPKRKEIFEKYRQGFEGYEWAQLPEYISSNKVSSYHVFPLRIKGITEQERDAIVSKMGELDIATNVHFQPLPLLSFYKNRGYKIEDYPVSYNNYSREISLPVYPHLKDEEVEEVINQLSRIVEKEYTGKVIE